MKLRLLCLSLLIVIPFAAAPAFAQTEPECGALVSLYDGWARASIPGSPISAAYGLLVNLTDQDDTLISASSDAAQFVELHEMRMTEGGVMQMRPVEGAFIIPARHYITLESGGYHLMITGLTRALDPGSLLDLTLVFEHAGTVQVSLPVIDPNAYEMSGDSMEGMESSGEPMEEMFVEPTAEPMDGMHMDTEATADPMDNMHREATAEPTEVMDMDVMEATAEPTEVMDMDVMEATADVSSASPCAVQALDPWARPTAAGTPISAAYMLLVNPDARDDALISVESDVAETIEIHTMSMSADGVMRMRPITGQRLEIPARFTRTLAPGGYHIMMMGLTRELVVGDSFPLTLTFERAGAITLEVMVREPDAQGDTMHMGG